MREPITIFTGATGLNIVTDPVRLPQQENNLSDLQVAINVTIDKSYRIMSRKRLSLIQAGNFHSLFCDGGDCFVVKDDVLCKISSDGSATEIKNLVAPTARMAYAQVGERTYYANGYENGIIKSGISSSWKTGKYTGPVTNRVFTSDVIIGHHLAVFYGRMLISRDNVLWWSEPFDFGLYDAAKSFVQFYTKIIMLKPVKDGLFLSTEKQTYFLSGKDPKQWVLNEVAGYPAIEWTDSIEYFSSLDLQIENSTGKMPVWASQEGAILGTPDGTLINLNKDKIIYPELARTGFGGIVGFNFIHGVK